MAATAWPWPITTGPLAGRAGTVTCDRSMLFWPETNKNGVQISGRHFKYSPCQFLGLGVQHRNSLIGLGEFCYFCFYDLHTNFGQLFQKYTSSRKLRATCHSWPACCVTTVGAVATGATAVLAGATWASGLEGIRLELKRWIESIF
jgi:hypothetical protein